MVRFMVLYDQPEDAEAFDRHYRVVHIPLAKKLPGLRRYTISRNARPVRGGDAITLSPSSTGMTSKRSSEISGRPRARRPPPTCESLPRRAGFAA